MTQPQSPSVRKPSGAGAADGMTLIELVAVMALIAMLLTLAGIAGSQWTRGGAIRGTRTQLLGALAAARQLALTHRAESRFEALNEGDRGAYALHAVIDGTEHIIGATNRLPRGIRFDTESLGVIRFRPDGSGGGDRAAWPQNQREIIVYEALRPEHDQFQSVIVVHRLTGYAHPQPEDAP